MSVIKKIEQGFASITGAASATDAEKAYVAYHKMLDEEKPSADDLASLGSPVTVAHWAGEKVRRGLAFDDHRTQEGKIYPYMRGSGAIVLGTSEGQILHFSYKGEGSDPVADKYGPYQHVAVRKLGQGALLAGMGIFDELAQYRELERILIENGLKVADSAPHHLGYAALALEGGAGFVVAGASGMLPHEHLQSSLREQFAEHLEDAYKNGWLDWDGDEFAGFHDYATASAALHTLAHQSLPPRQQLKDYEEQVRLRQRAGHNMH